jgi:hypothetical protein
VSQSPPPVHETEFSALENAANEADVKRRFNDFVRQLHSYFNQLDCLLNIQQVRRQWKARTAETDAFSTFACDAEHWYTFHHGGRNEAQFNVALWPSYLRVGLGFEFTLKKGGDPSVVQLVYACFKKAIETNQSQFQQFMTENRLEIEWADNKSGSARIIAAGDPVSWLSNPPREPGWIFLGRLLRSGHDSAVLEDPYSLGNVMQTVLCGFRPIWEQTQLLAHKSK